jgi:hypothetical protein
LGYGIEWLNEVGYRSHIFAQWIPDSRRVQANV